MTTDQILMFGLLALTLAGFVWNRWRYDLVAMSALLAGGILGLIPHEELFLGFGHPAVVTVAAVLILSRGLQQAGVVDALARRVARVGGHPVRQLAALLVLVTLMSAVMNNVGALALMMPVAVLLSRKSRVPPGMLLMPLAFGSLLGGTMTMIGTPPNIILAAYRTQTGAPPFGMFDFFHVGAGISLIGGLFILLGGWRLIPQRMKSGKQERLFEVSAYLTEVEVPANSRFAGKTLFELMQALQGEAEFVIVSRFREGKRQLNPSMYQLLQAGDLLLVSASPESLALLLQKAQFELAEDQHPADESGGKASREAMGIRELIVTHASPMLGKNAKTLEIREKFGVNILGVARQGHRLRQRISSLCFQVGDILLVQVSEEGLSEVLTTLGCLPLAARPLELKLRKKLPLAVGLFGGAILVSALGGISAALTLSVAALLMVFSGILTVQDAVKRVELPVLILLGAMIPVGKALESSGGARLLAEALAGATSGMNPAATLFFLLLGTALLSNLINNAAAAILVAPIALDLAYATSGNPDAFLMTVAIGASSAFLTPIGHQSNTLVMEPGGYRFGDYWRMGLPLTLLVAGVAVPLILWRFG